MYNISNFASTLVMDVALVQNSARASPLPFACTECCRPRGLNRTGPVHGRVPSGASEELASFSGWDACSARSELCSLPKQAAATYSISRALAACLLPRAAVGSHLGLVDA